MTVSRLQNKKINHVVKLIDVSGSMRGREKDVIKVVDNQVAFLAQLSRDTDQETRVTIYFFDDVVECVAFDTDVLRLPSIAELYHVRGGTALRDAFLQAQRELAQTCQLYGDHAFLMFGFTDGMENRSRSRPLELTTMLKGLPENWTTAIFVPDVNGKLAAIGAGFPDGNVAIWNTTSATGVEEVGEEMKAATSGYFAMRASGVSGTRTLFSTGKDAVNAQTIKNAGLQPMKTGTYDLLTVPKIKEGEGSLNKDKKPVWELAPFIERNGLKFVTGRNFYRLSKQELINGDKELAVREKATNKVFVGDGVRAMIGLSDKNQRVAPDRNPEFDIFVQSKSNNRHLFQGDEILILK